LHRWAGPVRGLFVSIGLLAVASVVAYVWIGYFGGGRDLDGNVDVATRELRGTGGFDDAMNSVALLFFMYGVLLLPIAALGFVIGALREIWDSRASREPDKD
jgi:hypothetical protein